MGNVKYHRWGKKKHYFKYSGQRSFSSPIIAIPQIMLVVGILIGMLGYALLAGILNLHASLVVSCSCIYRVRRNVASV